MALIFIAMDREKRLEIARLQRGEMPIHEPHLTELLAEAAKRVGHLACRLSEAWLFPNS